MGGGGVTVEGGMDGPLGGGTMGGGSAGGGSAGGGSAGGGGTNGGTAGGGTAGGGLPGGGAGSSGDGDGPGGSGGDLDVLDGEFDDSLDDFEVAVGGSGGGDDYDDAYPTDEGGGSDAPLFEEVSESGGGDGSSADGEGGGQGGGGGGAGVEGDGSYTVASSDSPVRTMPDSAVPDDIGDGTDDDIVARQLREAAMRETDPVLREKLWEEYRRYKNQ